MSAWLTDAAGKRITIEGRCTFGRLPENTVQLATTRASRWHALIHTAPDGAHWLSDLGSSNGVLLNGTRLREPQELVDGDQLEIGSCAFKFHSETTRLTRKAREQRHAEFIRQRTERPHDAFAPVEQAAVIVTPQGRVSFVSERARSLLETYFRDGSGERLPASLETWLRDAPAAGDLPLLVPRQDKRLQIRLIESNADQRILLLMEEQLVFAPGQLEQLGLTQREAEVLHWMAEGKTNPEIAAILGSSPATVKKQAEHIFAKLNVENRASAILRVIELRLKA